jgi:Flp pilus assembly protein TadD
MRARVGRIMAITAASLIWLAGCETTSGVNPFKLTSLTSPENQSANASADQTADPELTGSTVKQPDFGQPPATPELLGGDPNDDVNIGKKYFRQGSYGLAERSFRRAVEQHPKDAEAWLGLAASYDRLKRFDLADRAYANAVKLVGATPEIMNNQGFSYMLRGDFGRARTTLLAAQAKDPASPYIQNNLQMLEQAVRKKRMVN